MTHLYFFLFTIISISRCIMRKKCRAAHHSFILLSACSASLHRILQTMITTFLLSIHVSFIAILFLKSFLFQLLFYLYEKGIELNNIGGFFFQLTERHASYCVLTWLVWYIYFMYENLSIHLLLTVSRLFPLCIAVLKTFQYMYLTGHKQVFH